MTGPEVEPEPVVAWLSWGAWLRVLPSCEPLYSHLRAWLTRSA